MWEVFSHVLGELRERGEVGHTEASMVDWIERYSRICQDPLSKLMHHFFGRVERFEVDGVKMVRWIDPQKQIDEINARYGFKPRQKQR